MTEEPLDEAAAPRHRRSRWSLLLTLALAAVLLFLAFRGVNWGEMLATLQQGRLDYLAFAGLIFSVSLFLRGLRWRVLLSAEKRLAPLTTFWGTAAGYLGNNLLPARAGEVMRSVMISRAGGMSTSFVFATAMTERIMDAVVLVLISLLVLTSLEGMPVWLSQGAMVMGILGMAAVLVMVVAPRLETLLKRVLKRVPLSEPWHNRLENILEQFLLGMRAFQHGGRAVSFAGLTAAIWLSDVALAIQIALAFSLAMTIPQAFLLLAALGLSSAAPSTPGYVGIYQFVAVTVLVPFGFSQGEALVYILAFQALSYLVVLTWGLLGLWRLGAGRARAGEESLPAADVALHERG